MTTPKGLPEIAYNQSQKHVTHNEALRIIDGLLLLTAQDKDLTTPPVSPINGTCYIPATTASGEWTGYENYIAHYHTSTWHFYEPKFGWYLFMSDEQAFYWWDNNSWQKFATVLASGTNYWSKNGDVTYTLDPVGIGTSNVSGVMLAIDGGISSTSLTTSNITTSGVSVDGDVTTDGIKLNSATDWFGSASVPDAPALTSSGITNSTGQPPSATDEVVWYDGEWETTDKNFATVANQYNKLRQDVSDMRLQLNDLLAQLRLTGGCGILDD